MHKWVCANNTGISYNCRGNFNVKMMINHRTLGYPMFKQRHLADCHPCQTQCSSTEDLRSQSRMLIQGGKHQGASTGVYKTQGNRRPSTPNTKICTAMHVFFQKRMGGEDCRRKRSICSSHRVCFMSAASSIVNSNLSIHGYSKHSSSPLTKYAMRFLLKQVSFVQRIPPYSNFKFRMLHLPPWQSSVRSRGREPEFSGRR